MERLLAIVIPAEAGIQAVKSFKQKNEDLGPRLRGGDNVGH